MNKELAQYVMRDLNTPQILKTLEIYADAQIERAKTNLSYADDMDTVRRAQSIIRAMDELKKIRDIAIDVLRKEK